jgi:ZIP family zinc transporter
LGVALVSIFSPILPWALAFAAGAMIFVISDEIIPESHRKGFEREATFGLIAGFLLMMLLDVLFA